MATLLIDGGGRTLRLEDRTVRVESAEAGWNRVPIGLLRRVIIHGGAMISTSLLAALAQANVPVIVLHRSRGGLAVASTGGAGKDSRRRLAQYARAQDGVWCESWSRRLLAGKLKSEERLLRKAAAARPDLAGLLRRVETEIAALRTSLSEARRDQLLGKEGAAARAYFQGLALLFPPSLGFAGRNRRPPRDPVNACLSLGYTLVHSQFTAALAGTGLDPYVGFYHAADHGRESLAADLTELERTHVDALVWELFRTRRLRGEHFGRRDGACLLGKAGRRAFYEAIEELEPAFERRRRRYCRLVLRAVTGEDDGHWISAEEAAVPDGERAGECGA